MSIPLKDFVSRKKITFVVAGKIEDHVCEGKIFPINGHYPIDSGSERRVPTGDRLSFLSVDEAFAHDCRSHRSWNASGDKAMSFLRRI